MNDEKKNCTHCGALMPEGSRFCSSCGASAQAGDTPAALRGTRPSGSQIQPWHAVLLAIATFFVISQLPFLVVITIVLGTSAWAAVDSSKIQFERYQSGLSYGPLGVFFGCIMLWIVVFPWYLVVRSRIVSGNGVLKP